MKRKRPGGPPHVGGRAITLLVLLCAGLFAWGLLQALSPSRLLRQVPTQAPAWKEPTLRAIPTLEPEPLS